VTDPIYQQLKSGAGRLKLKALALLALGGDDERFEAAALLREAARGEARALAALSTIDSESRLGVEVERCGLLVSAAAPTAAALAWGEVLGASEDLPPSTAARICAAVVPQFETLQRAHHGAVTRAPVLSAARFSWFNVTDRTRARRELNTLLKKFPGEFELWYLLHQADVQARRFEDALRAVQRARRLEPSNPVAWGSELSILPLALPEADAREQLAAAWAELRRERTRVDVDVFWCFALASVTLAKRTTPTSPLYTQALEALDLARDARSDILREGPLLRGLRGVISELAAGRTPSVEMLYRVGLGGLVTRAPANERNDPLRLLLGDRHHGADLPRAAAG
jgi:hypothetical protein